MSAASGLTQFDKDAIGSLISTLINDPVDRDVLRGNLLDAILKLVPTRGPCSLLHMNRFFSELDSKGARGKLLSPPIHRNLPQLLFGGKAIEHVWERHLSRSIIEERIFQKYGRLRIGFIRLHDIFDDDNWKDRWQNNIYFTLYKCAGLCDLAYLWIRCANDDLWVVCIRRLINEGPFEDKEIELLEEFGDRFFCLRNSWYIERLKELTRAEVRAAVWMLRGYEAKEAAEMLSISVNTYNRQIRTVFSKLGVRNKMEACQILMGKSLYKDS